MGYKVKDIPYSLRVGRVVQSMSNLKQTCYNLENGFDFIITDICHANNFRTKETIVSRDIALTRSGKQTHSLNLIN